MYLIFPFPYCNFYGIIAIYTENGQKQRKAGKGAYQLRSCCFTGHRQIPLSELSALTLQLDATLDGLYREGCRDFYAGGAMGFDTLAASRVLLFRAAHPALPKALLITLKVFLTIT